MKLQVRFTPTPTPTPNPNPTPTPARTRTRTPTTTPTPTPTRASIPAHIHYPTPDPDLRLSLTLTLTLTLTYPIYHDFLELGKATVRRFSSPKTSQTPLLCLHSKRNLVVAVQRPNLGWKVKPDQSTRVDRLYGHLRMPVRLGVWDLMWDIGTGIVTVTVTSLWVFGQIDKLGLWSGIRLGHRKLL